MLSRKNWILSVAASVAAAALAWTGAHAATAKPGCCCGDGCQCTECGCADGTCVDCNCPKCGCENCNCGEGCGK